MKALFNRTFNRSTSLKDKDGKEAALAHSVAASLKSNPNSNANHSSNNSVPTLPPLSVWPPSSSATQRPLSSISQSSLKPLPEIVPSSRPLPPIFDEPESIATSSVYGDIHAKSRGADTTTTTTTTEGSTSKHDSESILQPQPKRVAFIASVPAPASAPPPVQFSESNNSTPSERKNTSSSSDQSQFKLSFRPHLSSSSSVIPTQKPSHSVLRVANPTLPISSSPPNALSSVSRSVTSNSPTTTTTVLTAASRGLSTPYRGPDGPSSQKESSSIRSGTPYSVMSANTSRILATASWSEAAEEDLVSNLGPRERTRQEVLWEIVASEERYVAELLKLKETFIDPLLHPFASASSSPPDAEYYSSSSPPPPPPLPSLSTRAEIISPNFSQQQEESVDHLPIAARFLSPLSFTGPTIQQQQSLRLASTPIIEGESDEEDAAAAAAAAKMNHPRSPYRQRPTPSNPNPNTALNTKIGNSAKANAHPAVSSASIDDREKQDRFSPVPVTEDQRQSAASRISRKLKKTQPNNLKHDVDPSVLANSDAIPPHLLPPDLRRCLEVIENGIVNGHFLLSEALRKRYEEQYPLVRSLADVFVSHSHILREYATYVLHLERALEQVDDALNLVNPSKRPKKQSEGDWIKLSRYLKRLEETASDKGETGLAISLSKPFQRLLKYPLLFQNLLFHTDPSTFEYESTLQMVAEVETIVRSIEDEKIQKEERDRTRDVFARIEGLEKIKQLAVPKSSRLLVGERMLSAAEGGMGGAAIIGGTPERDTPTPAGRPNSGAKSNSLTLSTPPLTSKNVKGKSSFRRLSDVLQPGGSNGIGGKKDLWLVVFNDVVLRCQRTGMTSLPLSYTTAVSSSTTTGPGGRTASLPDLGKTKYATTGRRNSHTKPRNLYRFIKIETWAMTSDVGASASDNKRVGIVSMEDISRSRVSATGAPATVPLSSKPIIAPMPEEDEDEMDSSDSDRKSKMSFSYWGADKVTLSHSVLNHGADGSSASGRSTAAGNQHKIKTRAPLARGAVRRRPVAPSSYTSRESSANAKFGSRLVNANQNANGTNGDTHPPRSASRKAAGAPNGSTTRRTNASNTSTTAPTTKSSQSQSQVEDTKSTVTRPAWDGSTRATSTSSTTSPRRPRNVSQTSTYAKAGPDTTRTIKVSSSTPSEDSGVGLYKQIMAQDPSINR